MAQDMSVLRKCMMDFEKKTKLGFWVLFKYFPREIMHSLFTVVL